MAVTGGNMGLRYMVFSRRWAESVNCPKGKCFFLEIAHDEKKIS
jgi:hypothetical protein